MSDNNDTPIKRPENFAVVIVPGTYHTTLTRTRPDGTKETMQEGGFEPCVDGSMHRLVTYLDVDTMRLVSPGCLLRISDDAGLFELLRAALPTDEQYGNFPDLHAIFYRIGEQYVADGRRDGFTCPLAEFCRLWPDSNCEACRCIEWFQEGEAAGLERKKRQAAKEQDPGASPPITLLK